MLKNQNFGQAIEALKKGKRVAREGWNGKGMFLFLLPASTVPITVIHDPALRSVIEEEVGGDNFEALGSIRMFTADKKILTGWLASQTDMLSEDWVIFNPDVEPMLYCIEVERDSEETYVFHAKLYKEPTREDILKIIYDEDINYNDKYGRFTYYKVKLPFTGRD